MEKEKRLGVIDDILYKFGIAALAAIAVAVLLYLFTGFNVLHDINVPCAFHSVTGLYCPGCGGTRAVRALLRGDIWQSFINYPPFIYGFVVYAVYMVRWFWVKHFKADLTNYKDGTILPFIYVGLGLMLVQWISKLVAQIFFNYSWIV